MNRRKLIKRVLVGGVALTVPSAIFSINKTDRYMQTLTSYTSNPGLEQVPGIQGYPGTPLDQNGLFMNEEHLFWPKTGDLLKWKLGTNPYKEEKKKASWRLPVVAQSSMDAIEDDTITWLGHASFLIHLNGLRLLIDPILGEPGFFLKRHSELPFQKEEFKNIDYILISHNHRDHCDKESIELVARQNPEATWLCGLGLDTLLLKDWTGSKKIQAAGWYQQYQTGNTTIKVSYLPTRHWSRRGLTDTNKSLWGAFMIESRNQKIYFGGDSGYGSHFKRIRELFGEVDYYLAGIGAFAPRWFMAPSHMHPEEAAKSCTEIRPKHLLPMHYGTFDLSDEPLREPVRLIKEIKENNAFDSKLVTPSIGEVVSLNGQK